MKEPGMPSHRRARKRTAFVPRVVFATAALTGAAVIPMCVTACGGTSSGPAAQDSGQFSVAAFCDSACVGVAADAFAHGPDGVAADAFVRPDAEAGPPDGPFGVAADAFGVADVGFGVADGAFGG
jgi:hypothetical protein